MMDVRNVILCGDVIEKLKELPDKSVHCVITSPPYFSVRDYQTGKWIGSDPECEHVNPPTCSKCGAIFEDKQIGLEESPELYVQKLVGVFREVWRVLRDDGIVFLNLGDTRNALAEKAWISPRQDAISVLYGRSIHNPIHKPILPPFR